MELFSSTAKSVNYNKEHHSVKALDVNSYTKNISQAQNFNDLGLCKWLCQSTLAMGFKHPTDIQAACIPAILQGRSVIGCAETGSGKTAAFGLPILHDLSIDPYGVFAVILTPTRELAIQIHEQFTAFGSTMGLKLALIIGGISMTDQSIQLNAIPHIIIATPGRLRHHLEGSDPPNLSRARYLVLDEADRLLAQGFSSELNTIVTAMSHTRRQTLLFSATMTSSLSEIEHLANEETLRFDLTLTHKIPTQLIQQYLFLPAKVKICYLVAVLRKFILAHSKSEDDNDDEDDDPINGSSSGTKNKVVQEIYEELMNHKNHNKHGRLKPIKRHNNKHNKSKNNNKKNQDNSNKNDYDFTNITLTSSVMIFVSSCHRCAEITAILQQLKIPCVSLHSMMSQLQRQDALIAFKNRRINILIATDVAGRGLDIPSVDLVINMDMPKIASDYIHRVGRTARAGKTGRSLSLITQYDIELVHEIEAYIDTKLELSTEVKDEDDIIPILNEVAKARKEAQLLLMEQGYEEKLEIFKKRKRKENRKLLRKSIKLSREKKDMSSINNNENKSDI